MKKKYVVLGILASVFISLVAMFSKYIIAIFLTFAMFCWAMHGLIVVLSQYQ